MTLLRSPRLEEMRFTVNTFDLSRGHGCPVVLDGLASRIHSLDMKIRKETSCTYGKII